METIKQFWVLEDGSVGEEICKDHPVSEARAAEGEDASLNTTSESEAASAYGAAEKRCADFCIDEQRRACLIRWPRNVRMARIPEYVSHYRVVKIAPLAFAAFHFPEEVWKGFTGSAAASFSVFCIMNAGRRRDEKADEGGPEEIWLPESITEIGQYAFWHCDRLRRIRIPAGVRRLREGTFGECSRLSQVTLSEGLEEIGRFFEPTVHMMPDVGVFSGCHSLKLLRLPKTLCSVGAETFNSCGLEELLVEDGAETYTADTWSRKIRVHPTAFDHAAALQWMGKCADGKIVWQMGLPAARDKILSCDRKYHVISKLPCLFFRMRPHEADDIARSAFRLDFSGRMAIARLRYPDFLKPEMRNWYIGILIAYYDRLEQFWPESANREQAAFELLRDSEGFTVELLGQLMYIAGRAHMSPELIYSMMEVRNKKFSGITGLESLAL